MNRFHLPEFRKSAALLVILGAPHVGFACATCYGASDSPLAQGMNWGIVTLLGVVGAVLFGVASFFVYIGRKSAALAATRESSNQTDSLS